MKAGILTFHKTVNYGAVLQAYALQTVLRMNHIEADIIDYNNRDIYAYYDYHILQRNQHVKTMLGKILRYRKNKQVWQLFEAFRKKYIWLSAACNDLESLKKVEDSYDAVICGSDQVWNPKAIYKDFDAFLLQTFCGRKIAYAASAGNVALWEPYLKIFWKALHEFDAISVRESEMLQATENLSEKKAKIVLDPSLLLQRENWEKIEEKVNVPPKYIFVYFLGKNELLETYVKRLQKQTKLPVINLGRRLSCPSNWIAAGPQHFLYLIHHAEYVLTTSFHGTVFSILYNKPFLVFGNGAYNSRMSTLLEELNMMDHFVKSNIVAEDLVTYMLNKTPLKDDLLQSLRKDSLDFLISALE